MRGTSALVVPAVASWRQVRLPWLARTVCAAVAVAILTLLDLIDFSQLIFSGTPSPGRSVGLSVILLATVLGSLVVALVRRGLPLMLTIVGASAIVQAANATSVVEHLKAEGVVDPSTLVSGALVACGAATLMTGIAFILLGTFRASLLAQLLPYPVLTGFLGGIGLLFIKGGLLIGAHLADPIADLAASLSPDLVARLGLTVLIGICAFHLPRLINHWIVFPAVIVVSVVLVDAALLLSGTSVAAAQSSGWLLDVVPTGTLVRPLALLNIRAVDPSLLLPLVPRMLTQALVAVIVQILFILSVELELHSELNIDRTFVASGTANLLASLFGSPVLGISRNESVLLHALGGGNWLGWSLTVAAMAALVVFGATPLGMLPRPLAGGALIALGLGLLGSLVTTLRTISFEEMLIGLIVCAATALLGATPGFLVGIALAILIFVTQYARLPAIRITLTGSERASSVIRPPAIAGLLRDAGRRTVIMRLQGYLFFLNAQAINRRVSAERGLRSLILDFRDCVGLDSSALLALRKVSQIAMQRCFDLLLVPPPDAAGLVDWHRSLPAASPVQIVDSLDQALRIAEEALLTDASVKSELENVELGEQIGRSLGCTVASLDLAPFVSSATLAPGETLLRQGEVADALFFIESGLISIELEIPGQSNLRIRTTTAGTIIGEVAMLRGGRRTATAVAQCECRVARLDRASFKRMEEQQPELALLLQRFLIVELAAKLADTTKLLEAEAR